MHVPKSPQKTIFNQEMWFTEKKIKRLEKSWAGPFRKHVFPLLLEAESDFASLYSQDMGAPNKPVSVLLGLLILKETNDLTDCETVEDFEFNLQWQYALETRTEQAHVCEKTLFNFRRRIIENDKASDFYKKFLDRIIEKWKIKTSQHRLDSTVILSNMRILKRMELFIRTMVNFLKKLKKKHSRMYKSIPEKYKTRYMNREGYFSEPRSSKAQRRVQDCALDLCELVNRFQKNHKIRRWETYRLMERLLREQCELREDETGKIHVWFRELKTAEKKKSTVEETVFKPPEKIGGDTLQNPSDPDATYSGYKGPGYKVQLAETCHKENPFQVIDYAKVEGAHESDQKSAEEIHKDLKQRGHEPHTTYADAGYVSGENIVKAKDEKVDLKGPVPGKNPEKEKIGVGDFEFDEELKQVKNCPCGQVPESQTYNEEKGTLEALFPIKTCERCFRKKECPVRKIGAGHLLKIMRSDAATASRRKEQGTVKFKEEYRIRTGMEATISHLKNDRGMARLRVRGSPKVNLSVIFKALAENTARVARHVQQTLLDASKSPNNALA